MSDHIVEYLTIILLVGIIALLLCYSKSSNKDSFGTDNKPFEPDNSLLNRNPWDDIDYMVPTFLI